MDIFFKPIFVHLSIVSLGLFFPGGKNILAQATFVPREDFLYGEYYISQGKYVDAIPFYLAAMEDDPDNSNINYRVGFCYLKSIEIQKSAVPFLEKAVLNIDLHYVEGRFKDPRAPIESWLLLGEAYHRENLLLQASYAYHEYKKLLNIGDKEKQEMVIQRIAGLGISYEYQREEDKMNLVNMGSVINSRFSDYNPLLSRDEKTLIYTQFWESYDRILISHLGSEGWSNPRDITGEVGSAGDCYTGALSYDGTELYLIRHEQENYDIYLSRLGEEGWTPMIILDGKVNSRFRESSVSISADGHTLYFASDRPGGEGGFDIYRAHRKGNSWEDVQNLGTSINTDKDEEAPYISYDGTKLYFSSNGHMGIGNMDIFSTELDSTGNWSPPLNLGSPVNTTADDIFFIYFKDSKRGYLSRDISEGFGKNDIYWIQPDKVLNTVYGPPSRNNELHNNDPDGSHGLTNLNQADYIEYSQAPSVLPSADSIPFYTIQIYALEKPLNKGKMKLDSVVISLGDDGLHRYTYGVYIGWSEALQQLSVIRNSGYPDAFIRNVSSIQNYQGKIR